MSLSPHTVLSTVIKLPLFRYTLTAGLLGLAVLAYSGSGERLAEDYVGMAFKRALVTFALVRGINAVVSVVQGTEVSIEPVGVGVTLTPGEVLDPLNDLIERFSWVMLLAVTSLGSQKVLVAASGSWPLQLLLVAAICAGLLLTWWPQRYGSIMWQTALLRLVVLILFVRFVMPVVAVLNHVTYEAFLADRYTTSFAALEQTKDDVEQTQGASSDGFAGDDAPMLDRMSRWLDTTSQRLDVEQRLEFYRQKLNKATEQVVDLIVVFILTTVVFPLIFLYLGLKAIRVIGRIHWRPEN